LLELGECAHRGCLDAVGAAAGAGPEGHRQRDRFVVVEEQRRDGRPGRQSISADRTAGCVDLVAEAAQPLDVVADRPGAHLEPFGELSARPVARRLEEREEAEHPSRSSHDVYEGST
jgi:hypothetical protein